MIIELLISGIIGQGASLPITITDNKDGTVTVEGPSNDEERLSALYKALSERRDEVFNLHTKIFNYVNGDLRNMEVYMTEIDSIVEQRDLLLKEIEPLETEYDSLYKRMYPEMKDLVK